MEFHVITSTRAELVMRVVDGQVLIVPPPILAPATPAEQTTVGQKPKGNDCIAC